MSLTKYATNARSVLHLFLASLVKQKASTSASFGFLICKLWEWLSTLQLCVCVYLYEQYVHVSVHVCICLNLYFTRAIHVSLLALFPLSPSSVKGM